MGKKVKFNYILGGGGGIGGGAGGSPGFAPVLGAGAPEPEPDDESSHPMFTINKLATSKLKRIFFIKLLKVNYPAD
ncbi:MAG: hypothetical protein R3B84_15410 [Zavarzinella sp.]